MTRREALLTVPVSVTFQDDYWTSKDAHDGGSLNNGYLNVSEKFATLNTKTAAFTFTEKDGLKLSRGNERDALIEAMRLLMKFSQNLVPPR